MMTTGISFEKALEIFQESHKMQLEAANIIATSQHATAEKMGTLSAIVAKCEQTQQKSNEIIHRYNNIRQQEIFLESQKLDSVKAEVENKKKIYEKIGSIFEKPKDLVIFISILIGNLMLLFGAGDKGLIMTLIDAAMKRLSP